MKTNEEYEEITPEEAGAVAVTGCGCVIVFVVFLAIVGLIFTLLLTGGIIEGIIEGIKKTFCIKNYLRGKEVKTEW